MKIDFPDDLRNAIVAANDTLAGAPSAPQFKTACVVAQRAIAFYQKRMPELFADHNAAFFRNRQDALEAGEKCDACASLLGWRSRAHEIETNPATPENIAWVKRILGSAMRGQINLRT